MQNFPVLNQLAGVHTCQYDGFDADLLLLYMNISVCRTVDELAAVHEYKCV